MESKDYEIIADQLYKRGKEKQLRLCVTEAEYIKALEQAQVGLTRGHIFVDTTAKAIMMGIDKEFVRRCDECQRVKVPICKDNMPLRPMMGAQAFAKWSKDFVGPINPLAHETKPQYIIVAIDYLTK